jgi:phage gpG-like protein
MLRVGENYLTSLVASLFQVVIHQVGGKVKKTRTLNIWAYSWLGLSKEEKRLQDFCGTMFCK